MHVLRMTRAWEGLGMGKGWDSLSWQVIRRAYHDTLDFFETKLKTLLIFAILAGLGLAIRRVTQGPGDTTSEAHSLLLATIGPSIVFGLAVFIWHLWLAPYELALAKTKTTPDTLSPDRDEMRSIERRLTALQNDLATLLATVERNEQTAAEAARLNAKAALGVQAALNLTRESVGKQISDLSFLLAVNHMQEQLTTAFAAMARVAPSLREESKGINVYTMFDGFFVIASGIQKVLQQRYGYEGDFLHDWGQSAPTDVIAPDQDAVTEKYRERYRQIYAVFIGGEQALTRMREEALSHITRADAPL